MEKFRDIITAVNFWDPFYNQKSILMCLGTARGKGRNKVVYFFFPQNSFGDNNTLSISEI